MRLCLFLLLPLAAGAQVGLEWSLTGTGSYFRGYNDLHQYPTDPVTGDPGLEHYLSPVLDSSYPSLYAEAGGALTYGGETAPGRLRLRLDTGELTLDSVETVDEEGNSTTTDQWMSNGQTLEEEAEQTAFIRELFLRQGLGKGGWAWLQAGKLNADVGHSFVYNDYSPALRAGVDLETPLGLPLALQGGVLWPEHGFALGDSLLADATLALRTKFGTFSLDFAHLHDGEDDLATLFADLVAEATYIGLLEQEIQSQSQRRFARRYLANASQTSIGDVQWFGGAYDHVIDETHTLWARFMVSRGEATIFTTVEAEGSRGQTRTRDSEVDLDILGWAGELGYEIWLTETWSIGAFALALSGEDGLSNVVEITREQRDEGRASESVDAFISVVPYISYTSIFFQGGLDQSFSARQASLGGVVGRGVATAGVYANGTIWGPLAYQGAFALLNAMADGPHGDGRLYGVELDTILTWTLPWGFSVAGEADVLRTGDFFPERAWILQLTAQLSWTQSSS